MIPFLYHDMTKVLKNILELFIKPDVMMGKVGYDLKKFDLQKKENLKQCSFIGIGFAAESHLEKIKEG